jgi:hypothetical protein
MTVTFPADPILPQVFAMLLESLSHLEGGVVRRGVFVHAVRAFSTLNKEFYAIMRAEPLFAETIALCLHLYAIGPASRFCDRLPCNFSLNAEPADDLVAKLPVEIAALHNYRTRHIQENMGTVDGRLLVCEFSKFVRRQIAELIMHSRCADYFTPCNRIGCTRPSFRQPPSDCEAGAESAYWNACFARSKVDDRCNAKNMAFCSYQCYQAASTEYSAAFELPERVLEPSATPRRGCRTAMATTPSRLYRAALERNGFVARWMRANRANSHVHFSISENSATAMRARLIDALNVDTAILYAASIANELPRRRQRRFDLPDRADWRRQPHSTKSVFAVRAIYKKCVKQPTLVRGTEKWLSRVRDAVLTLF